MRTRTDRLDERTDKTDKAIRRRIGPANRRTQTARRVEHAESMDALRSATKLQETSRNKKGEKHQEMSEDRHELFVGGGRASCRPSFSGVPRSPHESSRGRGEPGGDVGTIGSASCRLTLAETAALVTVPAAERPLDTIIIAAVEILVNGNIGESPTAYTSMARPSTRDGDSSDVNSSDGRWIRRAGRHTPRHRR